MLRLDSKTRIVMVQVSIATTILMIGLSLEIIPSHQPYVSRGRASLCEAVAAHAMAVVAAPMPDLKGFEESLAFVVERNDDLLSAALRRNNGKLLLEAGSHAKFWPADLTHRSTDAFVHIPIYSNQDKEHPWGRLEMRFAPLLQGSVWQAVLHHPWVRLLGFFGTICFVIYYWYLRKVLDPTKAVPQRIRTAYDFLAGGLVAIDKQHRILLCNRAFVELLDQPRSVLIGKALSDLPWRHPAESPAGFPWERVAESHDNDMGTTLQFDSQRLGCRTLMINAAPVIGQDGSYRATLVGFEDITPLEDARAELQKSKAAAEAANVAKTAFLANMSHEIRTPMNAILGFAEILRRGYDSSPEDRAEYLSIIHSSGQHLLSLINDILDLSKVEAGRMEVEMIPCEPHRIVHEVISALRVIAEGRGLTLTYVVRDRVPAVIQGDPVRLRQVLTNLINNAIKFTHEGGVEVRLRVAGPHDDMRYIFDVVDTGIGIAPDKLDKVFDPFSQADSSTTRKYGGTGLGLSISRRFIELMGGTVSVHSTMGRGSTFTAEIPAGNLSGVKLLTDEDVRHCANDVSFVRDDVPALVGGRILLVDDGESNRKLIELVLRRAGLEVISAENGAIAVHRVQTEPFDVVLMDMQMPVKDGYTAARELRAAGHTVPIVAMTAHAMQEDEKKCLQAGCSHFLPKPVDMDRLLDLLRVILGTAERLTDSAKVTEATRGTEGTKETTGAKEADASQAPTGVPLACALPLDDPDFYEIVAEFVSRLQDRLRDMAMCLIEQNFDKLREQSHWLKGAGGTVGFRDFTDPARDLEQAARAQEIDACEQHFARLLTLAERIELPPPPIVEANSPLSDDVTLASIGTSS